MPEFILDSTVLSNFAAAGIMELLSKVYGQKGHTTAEVLNELKQGVRRGYSYLESAVNAVEGPKRWVKLAVLQSADEQQLAQEFGEFLDPGESSCLVLAVSRDMVLATDDIAARKLAARRNVSLTGTLGMLIELVKQETMTLEKANAILSRMIEQGYRSPCERLDELI
ncbi:MAG: hypothetical protein JXB06_08355 [Spirochaetales bacterium]|nr:hypothetical protein [Spirochaetales bacterium]